MIYSVWNQASRRYDYFETLEPMATVNADQPKHLRASKLGLTPSQAAWPLPAGARPAGSGESARGRVASRSSGGALGSIADVGFGLLTSPFGFVIAAGAGFVAWKIYQIDIDTLGKKRRKKAKRRRR